MAKHEMLCHECWCAFGPEEVEWFDPNLGRTSSAFYSIISAGYGCPLCDTVLDEANMAIFKEWKRCAK